MPQLADIATFSKRKASRKERIVPWLDFEPYLNQLRTKASCTTTEALQLIGYGGATQLSNWRREGVPLIALNAIRYILHDMNIEVERPAVKQFTFDELTGLFAALQSWTLPDDTRKALVKRVAREIQND